MERTEPPPPPPPPSRAAQLRAWLTIGSQSIGGGAATLLLMRRILINQRGWVDAQAFADDWSLSRVSPGMHMIALAALLGRRYGGRSGMVIALVGLLAPASVLAIALTAAFDLIRDNAVIGRVLLGMGVAALGMSVGVQSRLARDVARSGRLVAVDLAVFSAAIAIGFVVPTATVGVIVAGIVVGIAFLGRSAAPPLPDPALEESP